MNPRNISFRLAVSFCLLAGLLLILGWQGISHLRKINLKWQSVINDQWKEEQLSHEAFRLSDENSRIILLVFMLDDQEEIKRLMTERAANSERILELIRELEPHCESVEEKHLLDAVETTRTTYVESYKQALSLLLTEQKRDEAHKMMADVVRPNFMTYHDAWEAFDQFQVDEINQAVQQSQADYIAGRREFFLTLLLTVLFTIAIAFFTVSRMAREIADRREAEESLQKAYGQLEQRVQERTADLKTVNEALQMEMIEHKHAEERFRSKRAFLEAQLNSSIDGILVVDSQGKKILQNKRMNELLKVPQHIIDNEDDKQQIEWVASTAKNPGQFLDRVSYFNSHPEEVCRDELELKDGRILDRYSAPVIDQDGKYYGRIWSFHDVTERRRAEETLRQSEEKFRQLVDHISDVFWMTSPDLQKVLYVSPAYESTWGQSTESLYARPLQWIEAILPEDRERVTVIFGALTGNQSNVSVEYQIARPDGMIRWIHDRGFQVRDAAGSLIRLAGIATDITERKRLEARLFQSQKMETVGKLAGSVAHEFNSILTAIIGQSELLLRDLPPDAPLSKRAYEIRQAADRAATLARQLLAYGRKQIIQPKILNLNMVLTDMTRTLQHLMGAEVDVRIVPTAGLKMVKIDPGQMEQIIVNMAVNAADAMPNGGKLTLETANVTLDEEYVRAFHGLKPGGYVMLAITDSGTGMSEEVKARAFEPFFTTKGVGQGTGLGLATCYGIVKQSDGHITVYSEPGRGTTFKIYLPQVEPQVKIPSPRLNAPDLPRGTETILLAEDDPSLREMSATLLRRLGYTVLTAVDGVEALSMKNQQDAGHIDLLFTDVVMPHMSGKELADRIRATYPHTKILFTSAYTEGAVVHQGILNDGVTLLQKPFTPSALANKVREVLDQS